MAKDKILYFRSMWRVLRIIAFPVSLIYALVVYLRNRCYDWGWFSSKKYDVLTICIGNLSVGGTGKTPMIEYLIRLLNQKKLAVLSRGYKRKSKGFVLADSNTTVTELGDEPFQIYTKFSELQVAVDADRQNGIEKLIDSVNPDLILLDDAFQHRKVTPSFSILLTTYENLYVDDWYLPTGDLRDSKIESRRADIIIVTKCPKEISEREQIVNKLKPKKHQRVLFSWFAYAESAKNGSGQSMEWNEFKDKSVAVVTGIALPEPFVAFLKSKGILFEHLKFGDHHFFTKTEIDLFNTFDVVLTTEKDYVRLEGKVPELFYVEISHRFSRHDEDFLKNRLEDIN
ncbi:tetraacyldisaccharide 4'-kinase [Flagellimonas sp. S174]|uniref:tetraacyldisaccharide 4'-kinase n=1 Tax=Flagellimonas sp. S174 TaxID=3410790 RepID=UPI003BF4B03D